MLKWSSTFWYCPLQSCNRNENEQLGFQYTYTRSHTSAHIIHITNMHTHSTNCEININRSYLKVKNVILAFTTFAARSKLTDFLTAVWYDCLNYEIFAPIRNARRYATMFHISSDLSGLQFLQFNDSRAFNKFDRIAFLERVPTFAHAHTRQPINVVGSFPRGPNKRQR